MPRYVLFLCTAWLMLALPLSAQENETKPGKQNAEAKAGADQQDDSPRAMLRRLEKEQKAQQSALRKRANELRREMKDEDPEDFMKAMEEFQEEMKPETDRIIAEMLKVAAMADEDAKTSLKALGIIFVQADEESQAKAGKLLVKHHSNNDGVVKTLSGIRMPTQASYDLFSAVIEKTDSDEIKAKTQLAMMNFRSMASEMAPMFEGNKQIAETYPAMADFMKSDTVTDFDEDTMLEEMQALAAKHGEVELDDGLTIGKMVARKVKMIETRRNVAVGKVAPDIAGPDIDGENFKLSDYRGKVVMLDFWGDW